MTDQRAFDRRVRAWLELMPSEAPDRVIDAVLQAAETTPQLRPPIGAAFRRPFQMNRLSITAVAAVIVVLLAGGAFVLTRSSAPPVGASPSPSTSAVASPAASSAGALPTALQGFWLGAPRPSIGIDPAGAGLRIVDGGLAVSQANQQPTAALSATVSATGADLEVRTPGTASRCAAGEVGSYRWAVSPSGSTLTLQVVTDPCALRAAALVGQWWRAACPALQDTCLGPVDAGTYGSQFFRSQIATGQHWQARYGDLTFTVPAGWAQFNDWPGEVMLATAADTAATKSNDFPAANIDLITGMAAESQASPCSGVPQPGVARTPAAIAAWLGTIAGLQVSKPTSLTIDGRPAVSLDLAMPSAPAVLCSGTDPVIEYLTFPGWPVPSGTTGLDNQAIAVGQRQRLILVALGGDDVAAIAITVRDASTFDAFVQQAMPIVESFHFQ